MSKRVTGRSPVLSATKYVVVAGGPFRSLYAHRCLETVWWKGSREARGTPVYPQFGPQTGFCSRSPMIDPHHWSVKTFHPRNSSPRRAPEGGTIRQSKYEKCVFQKKSHFLKAGTFRPTAYTRGNCPILKETNFCLGRPPEKLHGIYVLRFPSGSENRWDSAASFGPDPRAPGRAGPRGPAGPTRGKTGPGHWLQQTAGKNRPTLAARAALQRGLGNREISAGAVVLKSFAVLNFRV